MELTEYRTDAYAKINLGLDVTGRRPDGYHSVRMIMQTVSLHDTLTFRVNEGSGTRLTCSNPDIPTGEDNLICRAVKLVRDEFGIDKGLTISLDKHIPMAAGLAGGSSDCAAALRAMNEMFDLGMSSEKLAELGVRLGADVPYCLMGGTALAEGIGEKLTRISPMPHCSILLVKPPVGISTPAAYRAIDGLKTYRHPDIDGIRLAIEKADLAGICSRLGNVLEEVSAGEYPVIREIEEKMCSLGADGVRMSGSGPTVFGIFTDKERAEKACEYMKAAAYGREVFLTLPC